MKYLPHEVAVGKLKAMVVAARMLRAEHGAGVTGDTRLASQQCPRGHGSRPIPILSHQQSEHGVRPVQSPAASVRATWTVATRTIVP